MRRTPTREFTAMTPASYLVMHSMANVNLCPLIKVITVFVPDYSHLTLLVSSLVPGQHITNEHIEYLKELAGQGLTIQGSFDGEIYVLKGKEKSWLSLFSLPHCYAAILIHCCITST